MHGSAAVVHLILCPLFCPVICLRLLAGQLDSEQSHFAFVSATQPSLSTFRLLLFLLQ